MKPGSLPCSQELTTGPYSEPYGSSPHTLILFLYDSFQYYFPSIPRTLTLREERRLRVVENRVLRRIFGQKIDDVAGGWRKLHNEGLHNLYSSTIVIRIIKSKSFRRAWHAARMAAKSITCTIFMGKPEEKRPLGRTNVGGWTILKWILGR
jgi:hypothetical protein